MPVLSVPGPDYSRAFNSAPGNYLLLSPDLTIVGVTDAYLRATKTLREEILGRPLFDVFPDNPDDPGADGVRKLRASLQRVLEQGRPDRMALQKYDIRRPPSEGGGFEERYWSPLNTPVLDAQGALHSIIHWVEDVTELVRLKQSMQREQELRRELTGGAEEGTFLHTEAVEANRQLRESERRYRFLADAVPQLIWTAEPDGQVDYYNARWAVFTGRPIGNLLGTGWHQLVHPEDAQRTVAAWTEVIRTSGDSYTVEHRLRRADGTWRWMLTNALPFHDESAAIRKWFGSTTDIHDQVSTREQLLQAQRMQAVGKVAGGMAHEVNNMMTAVLGLGHLMRAALPADHPQRSDLDEMLKAAERAADITRQLLAFSRQQVLKPVVLDANDVVTGVAPMLEQLVGSDRRLEIVPASTTLRFRADRTQIEQVLVNLVCNARDATTTDGTIVVRTDRVVLDAAQLAECGEREVDPGPFVRIKVQDNGTGMSPETLARALEPFFTTKAVGEGTGLGLSMVDGIVRQSGGFFRIESASGAGTAASLCLPQVEAPASVPEAEPAIEPGRGEAVLVVEDETVLRSLASRILEAAGYRVLQAPNGAAALTFLESHPGEVDLVLSDVVMPRLTGHELAATIRQRWPGLPVLLMSGHVGVMRNPDAVGEGFPVIGKPFTPHRLKAAVRQAVDRAKGDVAAGEKDRSAD
jgi:PAS domain S-box-containing protein